MKYFFAGCLFVAFVLACYYGLQMSRTIGKKYKENSLFAVFCFASAIWSLGYGLLILQTDPGKAFFCRTIGMAGIDLYIIMVQMLVCHLSGIERWKSRLFNWIACLSIPVGILAVLSNHAIYQIGAQGMTWYFKPHIFNLVYTLYYIVVSLNVAGLTLYMACASGPKRLRAFGRQFLAAEALNAFGMVFVTVFPLLGKPAIPGSAITQFFGLLVLYHAVSTINRSRITIENMSGYIYNSLAMPVIVYDSDLLIRIMNDAAASFFHVERGVDRREGCALPNLFELDKEAAFFFEGNHQDIDAVCRINRVPCSLGISKIFDPYGDVIGYIIIVTDLSERVKTVQKLEEAIAEAEAANHAKRTFLANMSHEIRTPMNAIVGFSELVLKMNPEKQVRSYVEDIKTASHNLLAIVNEVLDFSKIESAKMELVRNNYYTASLFNDVFSIIDMQAQAKGLDFHMEVAPDVPNALYGDKTRVRGILINLLNNAVKYTQEGRVSLEVSVLEKYAGNVSLEFKVSDTGIGIHEEEKQRLFDSFSQMDQRMHDGVEGTGLGLAIVKGYVELMGGTIAVESKYGEGSVFTVALRQKVVDDSPLNLSYAREESSQGESSIGSLKISGIDALVVDDNQINLKVAASSLRLYGLHVDVASGGQEAVDLCGRNHYRIIFMDQMMPQVDGIEAMKRIRKLDDYYSSGACTIIVLTANAVSGARTKLLEEGFDEYLGKPMNFKQLERLFYQFLPRESITLCEKEEPDTAEADGKQAELAKLQDMLPQIDAAQGVANCGGQLEDYLSILQMIFTEGAGQLKELRDLQREGNYKDYTVKIHAMKGSSLNIGARRLSELARAQELSGKAGEYAFIDEHMEEFLTEYGQFLASVRAVLEEYRISVEPEDTDGEQAVLTKEDIHKILSDIRESIGAFDFATAASFIRGVEKGRLSEADEALFADISRWMEEMETEKIEELIDRYMAAG